VGGLSFAFSVAFSFSVARSFFALVSSFSSSARLFWGFEWSEIHRFSCYSSRFCWWSNAWILAMGLGVTVFEHVLANEFAALGNGQPIPRRETQIPRSNKARTGGCSLDAGGALGLGLHYLNSTMAGYTLQPVFGITPAVFSRYLNWGLIALQHTLRSLHEVRVKWPTPQKYDELSAIIHRCHPLLHTAIGFLDGCHLPVAASSDVDIQNAYYNGWCAAHFTSNLFVFAPDGSIIYCSLNNPGSWHDAAIARELFGILINNTPDGYFLIGDTAFPTTRELANKI
jgi:hypothetical protein